MSFIDILHYVAHLDEHLVTLGHEYGILTYGILFLIIFCETGLVVAPLLPGDSLIFVSGAVAGITRHGDSGVFTFLGLFLVMASAAFLGNMLNFQIGRWFGPKVFHWESSRWFNSKHLQEAHQFYEKHGGKTIVLSRFLPIVRTYAPFVAGIGSMTYKRFIFFNAIGGVLWVVSLLLLGYFFGNVPFIKQNLALIILVVVLMTLLPVLFLAIKSRFNRLRRNLPRSGQG